MVHGAGRFCNFFFTPSGIRKVSYGLKFEIERKNSFERVLYNVFNFLKKCSRFSEVFLYERRKYLRKSKSYMF